MAALRRLFAHVRWRREARPAALQQPRVSGLVFKQLKHQHVGSLQHSHLFRKMENNWAYRGKNETCPCCILFFVCHPPALRVLFVADHPMVGSTVWGDASNTSRATRTNVWRPKCRSASSSVQVSTDATLTSTDYHRPSRGSPSSTEVSVPAGCFAKCNSQQIAGTVDLGCAR